jgi:uncharacterized Zn finger protein (UPF0148 family)
MTKKFCKKCARIIKVRDGVYCPNCALEEYNKLKRKDENEKEKGADSGTIAPYDFKR